MADFGNYLAVLAIGAVAVVFAGLRAWRRPRLRYEQWQQQQRSPRPELEVAVDTQALADKAPPRASTGDDVDVSAFSPPRAARGEDFLVQVLAHRPDQDQIARALAAEADPDTTRRGVKSLAVPIELGAALTVELSMPGLLIDEPVQQLRWADRAEAVQFVVSVPDDLDDGSVMGTVKVSQQGIPIGSLRWRQPIDRAPTESEEPQSQGEKVTRYHKAFISYATRDRAEVLKRVQMLGRFGIDYFQDVLSLDPGQRWEQELYRQIEHCDLFLLFWSTAAKESEWVKKEALEALRLATASGESELPELGPVLIEGPPVPLPWPELAHLHFNDKLLYLMNG